MDSQTLPKIKMPNRDHLSNTASHDAAHDAPQIARRIKGVAGARAAITRSNAATAQIGTRDPVAAARNR
jgi:hypothetical protein